MATLELDLNATAPMVASGHHSADLMLLRAKKPPDYQTGGRPVRVVDLFCGCGGLTLGLAEASRRVRRPIDVRLAVDFDESAVAVFEANFQRAQVQRGAVEFFFDGEVGRPLTDKEQGVRDGVGQVHFLVGGPPCQGHSDLNNYTRRNDGRNSLYVLMARAAEVLKPKVVLIENVQAVTRDRGKVVQIVEQVLHAEGYRVDSAVLDLSTIGVPQHRRRHFLLATRSTMRKPGAILRALAEIRDRGRSVRWAIGDLNGAVGDPLQIPSTVSRENQKRMAWLFDHGQFDLPDRYRPACHRGGGHTYRSVYGRLRWDQVAPTITTGFTSMGQGRFVHPAERRTLTPREAARLQFIPDFFDFAATNKRSAWAEMIGNAVPPKLTIELGRLLLPEM